MPLQLDLAVGILFTAVLWGATDPLLKKLSRVPQTQSGGESARGVVFLVASDLCTVFQNWKYVLVFLLNQLGSVTFLWCVSIGQVSLVVPATNSLKFLVTFIVGRLLGEQPLQTRQLCALFLIVSGLVLQLISKN